MDWQPTPVFLPGESPWTEEPGGLEPVESKRVQYNWSNWVCTYTPSWVFTGRTDAEAPILWSPDMKSWLIGKDSDTGKDWGQEEKGVTEDEMVRWHHQLNGHEFEQTLGDSEGQGSLVCCNPHQTQLKLQRVRHNWATEPQQQPCWYMGVFANLDALWLPHYLNFMEVFSCGHGPLLTPFPAPLPSLDNGVMGLKIPSF